MRTIWALSCCALLASGCKFSSEVDPNVVVVNCQSNSECPAGYTCRLPDTATGVSQCEPVDAPVRVEGPWGLPAWVRPGELKVAYTVVQTGAGAQPLLDGEVWAEGPSAGVRLDFQVEPLDDGGFSASYFVTDAGLVDPEGSYLLRARFFDAQRSSASALSAAFTIDRTPPAILPGVQVSLTPLPGSPADLYNVAPTELGQGSTLNVSFAVDEPCDAGLFAVDLAGAPVAALQFTSQLGIVSQVFNGQLRSPTATTAAILKAVLVDRAGNVATVALDAGLALDTKAPVLDTSPVEAFVLHRAPWGTADGGPASFWLEVAPGRVADEGTLFVLDGPFVAGRGQVHPGVGAAVPVNTVGSVLELVLLDAAGNASDAGLVRDVSLTWVARGVGPGSENEGRLLERWSTLVDSRHAHPSLPSSFPAGGVAVESTGAWRRLATQGSALPDAPMAFDADRGRVVRFGGRPTAPGTLSSQTWEWEGQGWLDVSGSSAASMPPASAREAQLTYDALHQQTVLFHGPQRETWAWDGKTWASRSSNVAPPARTDFAVTFDERAEAVLLFGGNALDGGKLADTWLWDGLTWTDVSPTDGGSSPPARSSAALVYDPAVQQSVLFGGTGQSTALHDLWAFDWRFKQWRAVPSPAPSSVDSAAPMMVYDPGDAGLRVLVAAGTDLHSWGLTYNGGTGTWVDEGLVSGPAATSASGRLTAVYDGTRAQTLVTDGTARFRRSVAGQWRTFASNGALRPAHLASMAWDPSNRQAVVFGGQVNGVGSIAAYSDETWAWSASDGWRQMDVSGSVNGGRRAAVLAAVDGGLLLAGGSGPMPGQLPPLVLVADGGSGAWLAAGSAFGAPNMSATSNGSEALFWMTPPTYVVAGAQMTVPLPTTGPLAQAVGLTFDPVRRAAIAFGGNDGGVLSSDTWASPELGSSPGTSVSWSRVRTVPATTPRPRQSPLMYFDAQLGRVVMYGGDTGGAPDQTVWGLTDGGWFEQPVSDVLGDSQPSPMSGMACAYDQVSGHAVFYGGLANGVRSDQTWGLRYAGERPAVVFHTALSKQLVITFADVELRRLTALATAGGDAAAASGAHLLVWNRGQWVPMLPGAVATTSAGGSAAPSAASLVIDDPAQVEQLVRGHPELSVAVSTLAGQSSTPARLQVSDFSVTLDYRMASTVKGGGP